MALSSEILARSHESSFGPFPDKSNREILEEFVALDDELSLMQTLRGLNEAKHEISAKRNAILILSESGKLEIQSFGDATTALRALFELEKRLPESDIVLVRADSNEEVRLAFRNYFSDAREFVHLVDHGCTKLSDSSNLRLNKR